MNLLIDFGGTHFRYKLDNNEVITLKSEDIDLVEFISLQIEANKRIKNVAISFAGPVNNGVILASPNLGITNLDIKNIIETKFHEVTLEIDNDLNCAALVEYKKYKEEMIALLYMGTGFGSAFIHKGEIIRGMNSLAGEIGHIPFLKTDLICGCGRDDCLELSCSGKALQNKSLNLLKESKQANEQIIYNNFIQGLEVALYNVISLFSPNLIVLGGAVFQNNVWLVDILHERLKTSSFSTIRGETKLVLSTFDNGNLEGTIELIKKDNNEH